MNLQHAESFVGCQTQLQEGCTYARQGIVDKRPANGRLQIELILASDLLM